MPQAFTGLLAYPITPLTHDGELNLGALVRLVRDAAGAGVSGVTVLATSGAGVVFDRAERRAVTEAAVGTLRQTDGPGATRIPVYSAISAASTREVVHLAKDAEQAGAAGLLLSSFSYLPLSDEEVRALSVQVADATNLPLCFYNKPLQTQYDVTAGTLAVLAETAHLVAVKESMRRDDVAGRIQKLRDSVGRAFSIGLGADVQLLSTLPEADAWHTGLATLLPFDFVQVWRDAQSGNPQGPSLERLRRIAGALGAVPSSIGVLHALAAILGTGTVGPGVLSLMPRRMTWKP
ncbi:dihydrodipicolinate synthase family protein [Arthrobacter sp.]|uniref:dihydrodipicolinate synthase family protein n=1 Tax=Arthrobacter sp. TaxID=1667 RepID=UPI0026DEEB87|nr:dihydrodipicolinate synthase family protein [Arthrobacter sp.]MDO5753439.1 dihydrodipicolinate synthase family protein [Arthrobacter sp.]